MMTQMLNPPSVMFKDPQRCRLCQVIEYRHFRGISVSSGYLLFNSDNA